MTNKYKVSDLAKDFNLGSKDIISIVAEKTGAAKKSGASLDETEISIVFTELLNRGEVKSFADYFATGAESRAAAKKASAIPVLPLVGSTIVPPGAKRPSFSAAFNINSAARSLTLNGLNISSLAHR